MNGGKLVTEIEGFLGFTRKICASYSDLSGNSSGTTNNEQQKSHLTLTPDKREYFDKIAQSTIKYCELYRKCVEQKKSKEVQITFFRFLITENTYFLARVLSMIAEHNSEENKERKENLESKIIDFFLNWFSSDSISVGFGKGLEGFKKEIKTFLPIGGLYKLSLAISDAVENVKKNEDSDEMVYPENLLIAFCKIMAFISHNDESLRRFTQVFVFVKTYYLSEEEESRQKLNRTMDLAVTQIDKVKPITSFVRKMIDKKGSLDEDPDANDKIKNVILDLLVTKRETVMDVITGIGDLGEDVDAKDIFDEESESGRRFREMLQEKALSKSKELYTEEELENMKKNSESMGNILKNIDLNPEEIREFGEQQELVAQIAGECNKE